MAISAVFAATVAALTAWAVWWTQPRAGVIVAAAVVAAVLSAALSASLWPRPGRRLRFDGGGWWLRAGEAGAEHDGAVDVAIDLGAFLLLRFTAKAERRQWLALEPEMCRGGDWHLLRCAVYAHPPVAAMPATGPLAE